jgi:fumarate reductase flavoprotein subunit
VLEGALLVNGCGARFVDETADITGLIHPVLAQPDGSAWLIYDERVEALGASTIELKQLNALGAARTAKTLPALADAIGSDRGTLTDVFDEVCAAAAANGRDAFGREWRPDLSPRGPYRALKVTGALYHTQGGLMTDPDMRVLDRAAQPIPGLYAAGGSARGVSGPSYWGYLPAMGLGSAVAGGRIAGQKAALLAKEPSRSA